MMLMVHQLRNMVLPQMMLMVLPLLRSMVLQLTMLDAAVLVEDLAELLLNKLLVVDVQGTLEEGLTRDPPQPKRHQELDVTNKHPGPHPEDNNKNKDVDVDSSPSQSHTEDQGGTPLPSDIRDKRLNSKAD